MDELTCKRVKGSWNPRKRSCEIEIPGWSPSDDLLTADIRDTFENERGDRIVIQGTSSGWNIDFVSGASQLKTPVPVANAGTEAEAYKHAIEWMKKHRKGI